jgi:hypothetical protein
MKRAVLMLAPGGFVAVVQQATDIECFYNDDRG